MTHKKCEVIVSAAFDSIELAWAVLARLETSKSTMTAWCANLWEKRGFLNIVAMDGAAHGTNDCRHKEQLFSKGAEGGLTKCVRPPSLGLLGRSKLRASNNDDNEHNDSNVCPCQWSGVVVVIFVLADALVCCRRHRPASSS